MWHRGCVDWCQHGDGLTDHDERTCSDEKGQVACVDHLTFREIQYLDLIRKKNDVSGDLESGAQGEGCMKKWNRVGLLGGGSQGGHFRFSVSF